jgi:hypothetical protein
VAIVRSRRAGHRGAPPLNRTLGGNMRSIETKSVLRDPVVLVALLGWLVAASLFLSFHSILEGANTGENRWPVWLVEALLWLQLLALVSSSIGSLGKSAANLVYGKRLLPNILAIALSLPMLMAAFFLAYLLVWVWQWASP